MEHNLKYSSLAASWKSCFLFFFQIFSTSKFRNKSYAHSAIKAIKIQMDEFQQQSYDKLLQIVGMSKCSDGSDDTKQIVKFSKEKLGIKLKSSDIEEVTRLGKKSDFKDVLHR